MMSLRSFINPIFAVLFKVTEFFLREPVSNFFLGVFNSIGTVADVSSNIKGEVTSDGAWVRFNWLGGAEESSTGLDGVQSFPDHSDDWTAHDVIDEVTEESLVFKVTVML